MNWIIRSLIVGTIVSLFFVGEVFILFWLTGLVVVPADFVTRYDTGDLECAGNDTQPCLGYNGEKTILGLAYESDYFCVYSKGMDITKTLNVCAHEWAHTHEGLKDP